MQMGRDAARQAGRTLCVYPIDQTVRLKRDRLTALPFSGTRKSKGRTVRKYEG
jgi:hypothetical protein